MSDYQVIPRTLEEAAYLANVNYWFLLAERDRSSRLESALKESRKALERCRVSSECKDSRIKFLEDELKQRPPKVNKTSCAHQD